MATKYARCPCGEVPTELVIENNYEDGYANVAGNCQCNWVLEFYNGNLAPGSEVSEELAEDAWNTTLRKGVKK